MSPVRILICPNKHRFPVNLEKHQNRNYVMCPKCGARVQVRASLGKLKTNPNWAKTKEEREQARQEEKWRRHPHPPDFEVAPRGARIP